jgi:hypothetical protein
MAISPAPTAQGPYSLSTWEMRLERRVSMSSEGLKIVEGLKGSKRRKRKRRAVYLMPDATWR